MPAPKRSASAGPRSSSSAKPANKRPTTAAKSGSAAARSGVKATATSTRKASARTTTQAKSGAAKTADTAKSGAAKTARAAKSSAADTAETAKGGAKQVKATAKRGVTTTRRASGQPDGIGTVAEQIAKGEVSPRDLVMLTRDRIQETLDDAASRGRVTRKDANELVAELVRRGRQQSDDLLNEIEGLVGNARDQLGSATKRARKTEPVDRLVRGADRVRRTAGVGSSFPILGYDDLNAGQVQTRLADLSKPELRKVLTYERKNAARKSVIGALEKAIG